FMSRPLTGNVARLATAFALFMACLAATSSSTTELASGAQSDPSVAQKTHVYVSDFELFENPSEEDVRKICGQIVSHLTSLISKNDLAILH
ncbi:MAG TPA: hypothetical protein VED66_00710, partial [Candidatus Sulfotelmatobacter sp.]|nr:hypothetical protein [Candidatus Sulfotelmatobacter sp.]